MGAKLRSGYAATNTVHRKIPTEICEAHQLKPLPVRHYRLKNSSLPRSETRFFTYRRLVHTMKTMKMLEDPMGNKIFLPDDFELPEALSGYDSLEVVISKPIMLLQCCEDKLYFFRAVDWGQTILLTAQKKDEYWEVTHCTANPAADLIGSYLQKCRQLI
jgi:hypothetical protein